MLKYFSVIISSIIFFTFIGCGGNTPLSDAQVTNSINTVPKATFDKFTINRNITYDGQLTAIDADGDELKYIIISQPLHGMVVMHDNGCFTYTPDLGYQGSDSFSYKASDDVSSCAVKTVTVNVCQPTVSKPTSPTNLIVKALSTTKLELTWRDNSDNEEGFAIYQDGKLVASACKNETKKVISCGLEAEKTYTFEVRAKNEAGNSDAATAQGTTKDVTTVPNAPTELKAIAIEETSLRLTWKDNADNESRYEVYQNGILIKSVSPRCNCAVIKNLEKCTTYTFEVKAVNRLGSSHSSNKVTIKTDGCIVSVNQAPIALAQSVTLDENTIKEIVLAGTDSDGDALTYTVTSAPTYGTYENGVYIPNTNYHGSDSFSFTASDGSLTSQPATVSITIKSSDVAHYKNILFAHGYQGSSESWDEFTKYISDNQEPWNVYRYSVGKDDSISVRATQLAQFINSETNISDNSLVTLGHSMGGLDLRFIVSEGHKNQDNQENIFYKASKKIHSIYTLATPHKGFSDIGIDDATRDMTIANMKIFNEVNPYSLFNIENRDIPLLSFRFVCDDERISDGSGSESDKGNDGVLKVKTQIFNGAPHTQTVFSGKHTKDTLCLGSYSQERDRTDILKSILDDESHYFDTKDIVFFEDAGCKGAESGVFSSTYKAGGISCASDESCENNEISSLMLFPNIKKGTVISLYSANSSDGSDDWSLIDIGEAVLTKPICISSFEVELSSEVSSLGITMQYHEKVGGESGLDGKVSYIEVK